MIEYFDRGGNATAFCPDPRYLFLWSGRPAASIASENIFVASGQFIGWMHNGWIMDTEGRHLLFEFDAIGGPVKPNLQAKKSAGSFQRRHHVSVPRIVPTQRPVKGGWSEQIFEDLVQNRS